jgi:cation transporter-like permease
MGATFRRSKPRWIAGSRSGAAQGRRQPVLGLGDALRAVRLKVIDCQTGRLLTWRESKPSANQKLRSRKPAAGTARSRLIQTETCRLAYSIGSHLGIFPGLCKASVNRAAMSHISPPGPDSYVSLAVIASAIVAALGLPIADLLIGLAITAVIPQDHLGLVVDGPRWAPPHH